VSDYIFISLIQSLANKSGTSANKKLFSPENDEQKSRGEKIVLAVRAFGKLPTARDPERLSQDSGGKFWFVNTRVSVLQRLRPMAKQDGNSKQLSFPFSF